MLVLVIVRVSVSVSVRVRFRVRSKVRVCCTGPPLDLGTGTDCSTARLG